MSQWNKKVISRIIPFLLLASLFALVACSTTEEEEEAKEEDTELAVFEPLDTTSKKVVAEYDDNKKITEGELNQYLNILAFLDFQVAMLLSQPELKDEINDFNRILLKGYAAELKIAEDVKRESEFEKKAADELKSFEESIKNQNQMAPEGEEQEAQEAPKNLDEAIKDKGFNKEQLTEFVVRSLQRNEYFENQMKDLDYDKVKANHILISFDLDEEGEKQRTDAEAKKRAEEVKKKLEQTGDFDKLAKEYSDDPGSKEEAGLVEGSADQFVPEFAKEVKTIELNKISDPIKTEYGYHVLRVTEREKESLDEAPEEVKQQKMQELNQAYIDDKVEIEILLPESKKG